MAPPVCVIVNVSARSDGAAHVASELNRFFEAAGIPIEIKLTTSAKNFLEEVSAAILREPSTIIVGGGDGTLSEAGLPWAFCRSVPSIISPRTFMSPSILKVR